MRSIDTRRCSSRDEDAARVWRHLLIVAERFYIGHHELHLRREQFGAMEPRQFCNKRFAFP